MTEEPRRPRTDEEMRELLTKGMNMKPLTPPTLVAKPPFEMSDYLGDDSGDWLPIVVSFALGYLLAIFTAFVTWLMTK